MQKIFIALTFLYFSTAHADSNEFDIVKSKSCVLELQKLGKLRGKKWVSDEPPILITTLPDQPNAYTVHTPDGHIVGGFSTLSNAVCATNQTGSVSDTIRRAFLDVLDRVSQEDVSRNYQGHLDLLRSCNHFMRSQNNRALNSLRQKLRRAGAQSRSAKNTSSVKAIE